MDIVGAAETGSGKTLAFGIPIVQGILQDRRQEQAGGTGESADQERGGQSADKEGGESADEMEAESPDSLPEEEKDNKFVTAEGNKKKGQSNIRTIFGNLLTVLVIFIVQAFYLDTDPDPGFAVLFIDEFSV
jgi:ATP-dependent helicase YprA (DUF1998 family)